MGRTFKEGRFLLPFFFYLERRVCERNKKSCCRVFCWVEIGETAMITHAPESKVIAASRLFRASLFGSHQLIRQSGCHIFRMRPMGAKCPLFCRLQFVMQTRVAWAL
jgi:hypothetical protein